MIDTASGANINASDTSDWYIEKPVWSNWYAAPIPHIGTLFLIHNVFQWNETNVTIPFLFINQAALWKQDSNNLWVEITSDSNQA